MSRHARRHARRPIAERLEDRHLLSVYGVTNTEDSGAGTLRQAILDANGNAGADQIHFNIPGTGTRTIALLSALPEIDDPVTIDGATQPGYSGKPLIDLDGAHAGAGANGLTIRAGNSTINGLAITDFRVAPNGGFSYNLPDRFLGGAGILLNGGTNDRITANDIGVDPASHADRGNGADGLAILGSSGNTISGNTIVDNGLAGIAIQQGDHNAILTNSINNNGSLGIDLLAFVPVGGQLHGIPRTDYDQMRGVTGNTPAGSASGPNDLQNYPVITSVTRDPASTTVAGTLDSTPSTAFNVQVFASNPGDPSGFGEGQSYLGQLTATTDASGHATFSATFPISTIGQRISTTATDPAGNTSEFSRDDPAPPIDLTLTSRVSTSFQGSFTGRPSGGATVSFQVTNLGTSTATGVTLVANLPSGLFQSIPPNPSIGQGTFTYSGNTFNVAIGSIAGGASVNIVFAGSVNQVAPMLATASVSSDRPDVNPADNTTTALIDVTRPGDFDGNGRSDIAVYDPQSATYFIAYSSGSGGGLVQQFGTPGHHDIPINGDFDGDGTTDLAVFDPVSATFYIAYSSGKGTPGVGKIMQFGIPNGRGIPVGGDFDGDGKTDIAVYDPVSATFFILESSGGPKMVPFGVPNGQDIPIAGDYDGDGKTDLAIYDPINAIFFVLESGGGSKVMSFGAPNGRDLPIAGDYDGDGKTDIAVFDPSTAYFYILESGGGSKVMQFGAPDGQGIPVAADLDGDGKTDLAVFDKFRATYSYLYSSLPHGAVLSFGAPNGQGEPIPATLPGAILGVVQASDFDSTPDAASLSAPDFTRRDRRV